MPATFPILYPMFAMVLLTVVVLLSMAMYRIRLVRSRKISFGYYRTFSGKSSDKVPERFHQFANNFTNLCQMPTIFYAACCTIMALKLNDPLLVNLAWGFVVFRALHSYIHTTYNNVMHRFPVFVLSNVTMMIMWIRIMVLAG